MEKGYRNSSIPQEKEGSSLLDIFARIDPLRIVRRSFKTTPLDEKLSPLILLLKSSSLVDGTPVEEALEDLYREHATSKEWLRSRSWPPLGLPEYMLEILGWCLRSAAFKKARKWENRILAAAKPGPRSVMIMRAFIDETLLGELRRRVNDASWSDAFEFGSRAREYLGSLRPEGELLLALSAVHIREVSEGERIVSPWRGQFKRSGGAREPLYSLYRRVENAILFERARIALHEGRMRDATKLFAEFKQIAPPQELEELRVPLGLYYSAALYSMGRFAQACAELRPVTEKLYEAPAGWESRFPEADPTVVLNTFARSAVMSGKSAFCEDALRAAEAGAHREPENPILLSTLSLILLWAGKGREALNHLLAIKAPRNSELGIEVTALKAYAYHLVGNPLRAQELYTEAARRQPRHPIFKLLKSLFFFHP